MLEPLEVLRKIKFEQRFQRLLERNAVRYSQFWDLLQDEKPGYERFMAVGASMVQTNRAISNMWKTLCSLRSGVSMNVIHEYVMYCKWVKVDTANLDDIQDRFQSSCVSDSTDFLMQYMGSGDGLAAVSANSQKIGRISQVNGAFCQISGYTKDELRDHDIAILIPTLFDLPHKVAFEEESYALEVGHRRAYDMRQTFILHKSRYLVPVNVLVVDSPSIINTYCFIARIRPMKQSQRGHHVVHILTDDKLMIKHVSSSNST